MSDQNAPLRFPFLEGVQEAIPTNAVASAMVALPPKSDYDVGEWRMILGLGRYLGLALGDAMRLGPDNVLELDGLVTITFRPSYLQLLGDHFDAVDRLTLPVPDILTSALTALMSKARRRTLYPGILGRVGNDQQQRMAEANFSAYLSRTAKANGINATFRDFRRFLMFLAGQSSMSRVSAAYLFGYRYLVPPVTGSISKAWSAQGGIPDLRALAEHIKALSS